MRAPIALLLPMLLPALLPLGLAACSGAPPGGDLAVTVVGDGAMDEELAAAATCATLVTRAADGTIAPGLATSWRFLDAGEDLILRLAPLRWPSAAGNEGPPLEARNLVDFLRRPPPAAAPALQAAGLSARGTARAPIARVVELTPRPATPHLLDWLAEPALALRDRRGRAFPGPYTATRKDGVIRLERRTEAPRPDARPAMIRIDRAAAADAVARFRAGDRQLVLGEGLDGLIEARGVTPRRALRVESVQGVIGLAIDPAGALADVRLRRALLLAADGAALADRLALAALVPQNRLWDGLPPAADDRALPLMERQARAAALLAEAGFGPGQPLSLTLLLPRSAEADLLARQLSDSLAPLGIVLRTLRQPVNGRAPRHDLALAEHVMRVPDAVAHLARWRCGQARPCSAEADRLLEAARAAGSDLPTRAAAIDQAEQALMADPAFVPLLRPVRWALVADGLTGFASNSAGWHPLGRIGRNQDD